MSLDPQARPSSHRRLRLRFFLCGHRRAASTRSLQRHTERREREKFRIIAPIESREPVIYGELTTRPGRTFKRRFKRATGYSPIAYVQHLRVEEAKRRLERTSEPIDKISWSVGYEDPAFFRRLFKRTTRITPGAYRRRFQLPAFADSSGGDLR